MRPLLLLIALAACSPALTQAPPDPTCNADTRDPSWECCDDLTVFCSGRRFAVCQSHHWIDLTAESCAELVERLPELNTYGTFCASTCPNARPPD